MEFTENKASEYYLFVRDWFESFIDKIEDLLNSEDNKRVRVIAISRKMPRFLNWIEQVFLEERIELKKRYALIKDKFELTSEIAIPFLPRQDSSRSNFVSQFLVIDDTIVLGNTIRSVTSEIERYFGVRPIVSTIVSRRPFCSEELKASSVFTPTILYSDSDLESWMNFVCQCNLSTSLPIDVEFPLLYTDESLDNVCGYFQTDQSYVIEHNCHNSIKIKSYNILIGQDDSRDYKIDFSKIRFFKSKEKTKLSVFAPRFVRQGNITSNELFKEKLMANVWGIILDAYLQSGKTSYRGFQSLAVAINYLLSISTFNEQIRELEGFPYVNIDKKDLFLLFGSELTELIEGEINGILDKRLVETKILGAVKLPELISSERLSGPYDQYKLITMAENKTESKKQYIIESVFDLSHFTKGVVNQLNSIFHIYKSEIFESYDSLESLFLKAGITDEYILINKSVDNLIDEGKIIPMYKSVEAENGETFWRRYFTSSCSNANL